MQKIKSLEQCYYEILEFNKNRGWDPTIDDIAKSIVIESAELLEKFQWSDDQKENEKKEIEHEVADVFWYLATFCNKFNINLVKAVEDKLLHNSKKYPKNKFKDGHNKEFYYSQKSKYRKGKNEK